MDLLVIDPIDAEVRQAAGEVERGLVLQAREDIVERTLVGRGDHGRDGEAAMRAASICVLPDPAPASTRWWPGGAVTASRCAGFSASSRYETSIAPFYVAPPERPPLLDGATRVDDLDR